jgi:hypothetical protein
MKTHEKGHLSNVAATAGALLMLACSVASSGCGTGGGGNASGEPSASAASAPSGSSAAPVSSAPPLDDKPTAAAVTAFVQADKPESGCSPARFDIAQNLLRGELTLAGRPGGGGGEIAASWLIQLQNKAQIGFSGFDGDAKRLARDRGIGNAREHAPRLFTPGGVWTVVWFDAEGLAYARPVWEAQPAPAIEHLSPLKDVNPADVAFAATPGGALVVASPFATQGDQLSLFLFASTTEGQKPSALGRTKSGKKPRSPAVAADAAGYTVAWVEEDGHIEAARFDAEGNLQGGATAVARPAQRTSLVAAAIEGGTVLVWVEEGSVYGRVLGPDGKPKSSVFTVGKGKDPVLVSAGADSILGYVGEAEGAADQMLAVRVSASGPSTTAIRLSDSKVLDPPAAAVAGPKLAFAWTEVMNPLMSAKRAVMKTVVATCLK